MVNTPYEKDTDLSPTFTANRRRRLLGRGSPERGAVARRRLRGRPAGPLPPLGIKIRRRLHNYPYPTTKRNNRPLAKLDKAVKVADASNQRKAKCKTVSAIAVALREDTKSFDKADNVFNKDTIF